MKITDSGSISEIPLRRIGRGLRYALTAGMLFLASCNGNIFPNQRVAETPTKPAPTEIPTNTTTPTLIPTTGPLNSPLPIPTTQPVPTEVNTPNLANPKDVATITPNTPTPPIDYKATNVVLGEDLVKEKAKVKELEDQLKAEKAMAQLNSIDSTYIEERLELVINLCTYCYQELTITSGITSTENNTVTFNLGTKTKLNIDMSGFTKTYTTEMGSVFMVDDRMVSQFESFIMLNYIPELLNKPNKNTLEQRIADRVNKNMREGRKLLDSLVLAIREFDKVLGLEIFIPIDGCLPVPVRATTIPIGTRAPTATRNPTGTPAPTGTTPPTPPEDKYTPTAAPQPTDEARTPTPVHTSTPRIENTPTPAPTATKDPIPPTDVPQPTPEK